MPLQIQPRSILAVLSLVFDNMFAKKWIRTRSEIEPRINESISETFSTCMHAEQNRIDHASADTTSADTGRFVFRFRLEKPLLALPLVYLHF